MSQLTLFQVLGVSRSMNAPPNARTHQTKTSKNASYEEFMHGLFGTPDCSDDEIDEGHVAEDNEIEDVEKELVDDVEMYGEMPTDEAIAGDTSNRKVYVRRYRKEWENEFGFLKLIVDGENERMKCIWCEHYKVNGPWGKGGGCTAIQLGAIHKHNASKDHNFSRLRWFSEKQIKLPKHAEVMKDRCKIRVIACMKLMYFIAKQDLAIMKYEALCELASLLHISEMPIRNCYSSYTNMMAGKEFLFSFSKYIEDIQLAQIKSSPFYALMVDETTDRGLEKHLIVYVAYLDNEGLGMCKMELMRLVMVSDGCAQTKYDAIIQMLSLMELDVQHLVGIATDGDSSMLGSRDGLCAKLRRVVPHLISVHCVAHREALAVLDACKHFPCLSYIDKITNKIYSWISGSSIRHTEFQDLLREMNLEVLEVLQIHDVRWLARGNVMARLTKLMPAILGFWKEGARGWYDKLCIYKVLFCIYMLADVLHELNILNAKFQDDVIDITSFSSSIEVTISSLSRKFLRSQFGQDTKFLKDFIHGTHDGVLHHTNAEGKEYAHALLYHHVPGKDKDGHALDNGNGGLDACIAMCTSFVQKVIECINDRFPDMYFFNATKLFNPQYYPPDETLREENTLLWLTRLLEKLGDRVVNANGCKQELRSFVDTLYIGCKHMSLKDAWQVFTCTSHWQRTYPNMMRLWQLILVLPITSVPCERGFSKHNIIKNDRRQCLKVQTLEALMRVSLLGPHFSSVDWEKVYTNWELVKARRMNSDL